MQSPVLCYQRVDVHEAMTNSWQPEFDRCVCMQNKQKLMFPDTRTSDVGKFR